VHALLLLSACAGSGGPTPEPEPELEILLGAHYYLWFPSRFEDGRYLRASLRPPQTPLLGEYSSISRSVVEWHIRWAAQYGVDFFSLDWWPSSPDHNARFDQVFLAARNLDEIRFCIFYELGDLGYDPTTGETVFDGATTERFLSDLQQIASRYFRHTRYLRVGTRPVLILYITRTAVGRFGEAMSRFRSRMAGLGLDPYVIGDEIYWEVARPDGGGISTEPQLERIALFDAITAYNLYDASKPEHAGHGAASGFLLDSLALYERYREAAPETPVIPLAMPGYNDRGVRLEADHYVIPREWAPGAGEGTFFARWLDQFALPQVDARLPMLLVTSWNEWSEDTAVEPLAPAPATASDRSATGTAYTQGYRYAGYETRYLEILREKTSR
jgi:hypothetical protein